MKIGRTLTELAGELDRQAQTKKDFVADQGALSAEVEHTTGEVRLVLDGLRDSLGIQSFAHRQLATHLGIPQKYYDKMQLTEPTLLVDNINTWLHADGGNKRMVRTLDGKVRAFLSSRFRPLDNYDLAQAILPVLAERKVQIISSELTETRLYLKGILLDLSEELPEGMQWGGHQSIGREGRIVAAVVISNSDVGAGSLRVEPSTFTTYCTNLAIRAEASMKKYHVGRGFDGDSGEETFSDATRLADDKAFWMKVKDVTIAAFNPEVFKLAIDQIRNATTRDIKSNNLPKVVEVIVGRLGLPDSVNGSILKHLSKGGDLTQWGLSSAITRTANDFPDYEGATELERAGGKVLALPVSDWAEVSKAE